MLRELCCWSLPWKILVCISVLAGQPKACTEGCMMLRTAVAAWLPYLVIDVVVESLPVALIQLL
jgi:hypothetical protein